MKKRFKPEERYLVIDAASMDCFAIYDNVEKKYLEIDGRAIYRSAEEAKIALENHILNMALEE